MARIITKPFTLTLPTGEKKAFAVGAVVEGDESEHWYVQAHSEENADEAPADEAKADKPAKAAKKPKDADEPPADEAKE